MPCQRIPPSGGLAFVAPLVDLVACCGSPHRGGWAPWPVGPWEGGGTSFTPLPFVSFTGPVPPCRGDLPSACVSLANEDIGIYEVDNVRGWHDVGFYLAIIGGFGSLRLFRSKKDDD